MKQQKMKLANTNGLTHVDLDFDPAYHAVWAKLRYPDRPCISNGLIEDLQQVQTLVSSIAKKGYESDDPDRLRYQILSSTQPRCLLSRWGSGTIYSSDQRRRPSEAG